MGSMRLAGKVIVVTGAAAGLGRAVTTRFAREGAKLVAADINVCAGSVLIEELRKHGADACFVHADISEECAVRKLFDTALAQYGRVDVLYANSGVLRSDFDARAHELTAEVWDDIIRINLRGSFLCAKYALTCMLRQGGGSIIHLGSPTGIVGCAPKLTAYSASKAGIFGLVRAMAAAYARDNIRVNSIIPGTMETPMNNYLLSDDKMREQFREAVPMGRLGTPEDIEGLATFLASDESAYCTGGFYACDGGLTAV